MTKRAKPSWATTIPTAPKRQFDRKTERSVLRSIRREAEGRWNGKGDPKVKQGVNS